MSNQIKEAIYITTSELNSVHTYRAGEIRFIQQINVSYPTNVVMGDSLNSSLSFTINLIYR